jgi:uncharacterized protein
MTLNFESIDPAQQSFYFEKLSQCKQMASDYSFVNLWGWSQEYGLNLAFWNELIWIRQTHPFEALWAPVGDWEAADWPSVLAAMRAAASKVIRVPQTLLELWQTRGGQKIDIIETRGQWDYLYSRQELIDLKGNRFHKKKNLVNQFKSSYAFEYLPFGPHMVSQALAMQEDWCTWRDCESHETLAAENKAIVRVLSKWDELDCMTGGALRVGDTLVAYTIAEAMPDSTMVIHFEKANPEFKGSYQAINQLFLENVPSQVRIVNREQDLDNEGLRKAKLSYNPIDFIRKYQVEFI